VGATVVVLALVLLLVAIVMVVVFNGTVEGAEVLLLLLVENMVLLLLVESMVLVLDVWADSTGQLTVARWAVEAEKTTKL
jgi:hypothetical protein